MKSNYPIPYKLNSGSAGPVVSPTRIRSGHRTLGRVRTGTIGVISLSKTLLQARSGPGSEMIVSGGLLWTLNSFASGCLENIARPFYYRCTAAGAENHATTLKP